MYNGSTVIAGANLAANGVAGETFALGGSETLASKDVQTNQPLGSVAGLTLGASGNGGVASNYNALSTVGSTVSVTPANVTLTGTRVFDGTIAMGASTLAANGVAGETFALTGSGTLTSKNVQTNQNLASVAGLTLGASGNGGLASNYNVLNAASSQVSVTPAVVSVTTADVVKVYDGNTSAPGASAILISGSLYGADALSGGSFAYTDKNAGIGNKTVSVAGVTVNDGNGGANYTVTHLNNTTSTINRANLAVVGSRVYDGSVLIAASNLAAVGAAGETFALGGSETLADKNVQSNQPLASVAGLTLGGSSNGGLASNYNTLSAVGSSVSVTPATLLVTGTRVYDGTTAMDAGYLAVSGVAGETFAVSGTGTLVSKNVQTNQALASTTGLVLGAGGNGGLASNYQVIGQAASSVSVTPRVLVVAYTGVDKVADGTTAATVLTVDDRIAGDTLGIVRTGNFRDPLVGQGKPVDVTAVSLTGADAGNYTVAPTGLTAANITAAGPDAGTLEPTLPPAAPTPPAPPAPGTPDGPILVTDPPVVAPPAPPAPPTPPVPPTRPAPTTPAVPVDPPAPPAPSVPAGPPLPPTPPSPSAPSVPGDPSAPPASGGPASPPTPATPPAPAVPPSPPAPAGPPPGPGAPASPGAPTGPSGPADSGTPRAPGTPPVRVELIAPVQDGVPGRVSVVLPSDTVSQGRTVWMPLPEAAVDCRRADPLVPVQAYWQRDGRDEPLPAWLGFDTQNCSLWARDVPEGVLPVQVRVIMGGRVTWVALTTASGL